MSTAARPDPAIRAASTFAALGDPTRLALVGRLADGEPRSIAALSAGASISRQAVTKHLDALERAGLVARARQGREARFSLRREGVEAARAHLDRISSQWDGALERLAALVQPPG